MTSAIPTVTFVFLHRNVTVQRFMSDYSATEQESKLFEMSQI